HDLDRNAGGDEGGLFLGAAAEDVGIAALEADDEGAPERLGNEDAVDLVLGDGRPAGGLADGDEAGIGTGEGEDGGADQPVVDHHVGGGEAPERPDREQLGVAGAGAAQRHGAGGAGGGCRKAAHDPPPRAARPGTIADRTAVQPACSLPRRAPCLAATPPHAPGARSFVRKNIVPEYPPMPFIDRKSTRLNSSHVKISYAVFCLNK